MYNQRKRLIKSKARITTSLRFYQDTSPVQNKFGMTEEGCQLLFLHSLKNVSLYSRVHVYRNEVSLWKIRQYCHLSENI